MNGRQDREGNRYIREYRGGPVGIEWRRWALWEVVNGRRTRVGTARTTEDASAFLRQTVQP